MPTYTATFRTDAEYATITVEAKSARQAMRKAQNLWDENQSALVFQRYDEVMPLNEIEITNASGNEVANWIDDDALLRGNAPEMLMLLEWAAIALKSTPRFAIKELGTDSRKIAKHCEELIAVATGKSG